MRILITGGSGFIGSNLSKRLVDDGHEVVVLDNLLRGNKLDKSTFDAIHFINGDVRDFDTVNKASKGRDVIFHFAAVLGVNIVADNPVETMDVERRVGSSLKLHAMTGYKPVTYLEEGLL